MECLDTEEVMSLLGSFGVGAVLGAIILYWFIKSYLAEKGKNLATKEDIEAITDKVESVKTDYAKILEEVRSNNQLKIAVIEREKSIKKEVYLEAIEAVTRNQNIISSFPNLNINEEKLTSSMTQDAGIIAKVQIVGSEETVKAITNFMASIGSATLELMLDRSELMQRKNSIEQLEGFCKKIDQKVDRYTVTKNLNLEGNKDQRLWCTINNSVENERKQREKHRDEINGLWKTQNVEHLKYTRKCMARFFKISELLPNVVLSVRKELEMDISEEAYLSIHNENIKKGKVVFERFLNKLAGS